MSEDVRRFPLFRVILFHGAGFLFALSPIVIGGAFGNAEARLGVYPHAALLARCLSSGDIFWNNLNAWGSISAPFGYEFHPFLLFFLLFLKPIIAVHAVTLLYVITAAVCATVFLHREGFSPWTSLFGGTAYAFLLWSWMFELILSVVPSLLIITLLAFQMSNRRPFIALFLATVSLTLLWAGTHVQFAVMACILSWLYLIIHVMREGRWKRAITVGISASVAGFLLALPRIIPLIAHVMLSTRAPLTTMQTVDVNFPLFLFLPRLPFVFPGSHLSYQLVPHMGAFAGACILLALTRLRRLRVLRVLLGIALVPLALSLPGVSSMALALPFVPLLGPPERWLFVSMVALIPVACFGFDTLLQGSKRGVARVIGWLFAGGGIALLCAIVFKAAATGHLSGIPGSRLLFPSLSLVLAGVVFLRFHSRPALAAVLGALSVLLTLFGMTLEWRIPVQALRGTPLFVPSSAEEISHVFAARASLPPSLSRSGHKLYEDSLFYANVNLFSGFALTAANDPTLPARTQMVLDLLGAEPPTSPLYATDTTDVLIGRLRSYEHLLPALGVHWVLSPVPLTGFRTLVLAQVHPVEGDTKMYRYAVRDPKPLAYVLPSVSLAEPGVDDLPDRLKASARRPVIVECRDCRGEVTSSGRGTFTVRAETASQVLVDVTTPEAQWMAVRRIALPGTEVTVDGQPVSFGIVYGVLVAVNVPPGRHTVTVSHSYKTLLKDSLKILRKERCLWFPV
ncbi:MAG: hypothetical protein Q7S29_03765 [Candidatus Peribacter sp.]|nr:hypothetical protein [Candidatus Peribacter sp.]